MRSAFWLLLLSGCGSAPLSGQGELGLAGLRRVLGLSPVVGHVDRSGGQAWLVHDPSGVRLARLPSVDTGLLCGSRDASLAVAFEGDPGAVLTFSSDEVTLWQTDRAQSCALSTPIFVAPDPDWELVALFDPAEAALGNAAELEASELLAQAAIKVPASTDPVTITLTSDDATIRSGADVQQLDVPKADTCGMTASASQAQGPDGVTWVQLAYTVSNRLDLETCEEGIGYPNYESTAHLWVEVARNGAMHVLQSALESPLGSEEPSEFKRRIDLPGASRAHLEYESHTVQSQGREGPMEFHHWSWSLVVGDHRFVLAEVE